MGGSLRKREQEFIMPRVTVVNTRRPVCRRPVVVARPRYVAPIAPVGAMATGMMVGATMGAVASSSRNCAPCPPPQTNVVVVQQPGAPPPPPQQVVYNGQPGYVPPPQPYPPQQPYPQQPYPQQPYPQQPYPPQQQGYAPGPP